MMLKPNTPAPRPWEPLSKPPANDPRVWMNRYYTVTETYRYLMIVNADQSAHRDWREFQRIKSEIWGAHVEAVELYPSESRVQDPSNAFFLWRISGSVGRKLGIHHDRCVLEPDRAIAPQRAFGT